MASDKPINFILGLIAGEGSFCTDMHKQKTYKYNVHTGLRFYIALHEKDKEVIDCLQKYFGIGDVGYKNNSGSGAYKWEIKRNDEVKQFAEWVEENSTNWFKKTRKYDSFVKWKSLIEDRKELMETEEGLIEYIKRAKAINETNRGKSVEEWINVVKNRNT